MRFGWRKLLTDCKVRISRVVASESVLGMTLRARSCPSPFRASQTLPKEPRPRICRNLYPGVSSCPARKQSSSFTSLFSRLAREGDYHCYGSTHQQQLRDAALRAASPSLVGDQRGVLREAYSSEV